MIRKWYALAILFMALSASFTIYAQAPVASFTASKTAGCSPVVVQFTDQSTGSPTSWHWDLGNGGTSTLQNPAATYITPGTYTVILTATNNNGSSKDTNYITVYTSPAVNFTADTTTACGNKTVTFTNQTIPGAGGAVSYFWDFGDGDSSTAVNPTHTYTYPGSFAVSLVVINSSGCTSTVTKNNYIKVIAKPVSAFTANNTSGCTPPFQVTFTNSSSNGTSYQWSFGDGNSSTATNPTHTYTSAGTYNVRLITTGANGCKDTLTKNAYIVIGQVTANFTTSSPVCAGQSVTFTNTTTPGAGISRSWNFGNGGTSTALNPTYTYATAGTYTVTLIEQYANNCSDTIQKSVTVNAKPTANFTSTDTIACAVPFSADFTNASTGATSYAWTFGSGSSTATNPTHIYNAVGIYSVTLVATASNGCKDTFRRNNYIKIRVPVVTLTANTDSTCANTPVQFSTTLNAPPSANNYRWDFGDGSGIVNCASCNTQTHSYSSNGTYTVTLVVTTATGCYDTVTQNITISAKPTAGFTGSPLTICPDATVSFTNSSTGANSYFWIWGDGFTDTTTNPGHTYNSAGTYTVSLIASNNGCADTLTRTNYITVQLPHADFYPTFQCSSRLTYTFLDSSIGANTYLWDFGDGNTSTTAGNVTHTYASAGTYNVELRVYNTTTGCYDTIMKTITPTTLAVPDFYAIDTTLCRNASLTLVRDAAPGLVFKWYIGPYISNSQGPAASYGFNLIGNIDVKLVVTDSFGCKDSLVKPGYLKYGGANVDFVASNTNPCKNVSILFDDVSTPGAFPIVNRYWDFGDGTQVNTSTDTISHSFNNPGPYTIKLVLTDANGCKDSLFKTHYIYAHKPTAQFYSNDTIVCAGDTVDFSNNSGGTSFTSYWQFGDGGTSTNITPYHIYNAVGDYTVKLTITDSFGCKDSMTRADYIKVQKPTAAFTMSDTVADCPPITVYMTNTSTNSVSYAWTFGNNNQSSFTNPSTTYTYPGVYTVKLVATNVAGCKDSTSKNVTVNGPTGTYSYTPLTGCNPLTVQFTAVSSNTTSYIWDMNNGYTQTTGTGSFSYTYTQSGRYVPKLILSDGALCQVPIQNTDTVSVDEMEADFSFITAGNLCNTDTVYFDDTIINTLSGISSRSWTFGDGGTSTAEDPSHYYNAPGTYQVRLIVANNNGCKDTITKTITIHALPPVSINASADSLCPGQTIGAQLTASGASTYTWTPATGLSCTNCANPIANPQTTTTYIVTGTDTNGCINNDTVTIHLKLKPVITITGDTVICEGESTQLTATGAGSYTWSPATGLSCTGCSNPSASPTVTDTFTIIGTNGSGCKDTAEVTIIVLPKPVVTTNSNQTICNSDTALLVATGADTYVWSPTATLSCGTCDSTLAFPAVTTNYTVIGTLANGCKDTAAVTVQVDTLPAVSAGPDKEICIGSSTSLQATGANTYTWTPASGLSCTNCAAPTANPTATTTYVVTGTNGNNCSARDTIKVTVNPLPVVSAGGDTAICKGIGVTLQVTGADTFTWTPATGLSCTNCPNPIANPATTTTYIVTGKDSNACSAQDTVTVTVNAQPLVAAGSNKTICLNDSVQLLASGANSYAWSPATGLSCTNCPSPMAGPATTTIYTVIGTDGNGCMDTATVTVNVNPLPVISAGANKEICIGNSVQLTAAGGVSYVWSPNGTLSCGNCSNPIASPTTTTTYTISGVDANGCTDTGQITVVVNPLPVVSAGSNQSICLNDSAQLGATGADTFTWSPSTGLSCTNCPNPKASPATTTTYTVTGVDTNGCSNTSTVTVTVKPLPNVNAGSDAAICLGSSVQLQATGAGTSGTYKWVPGTGLSCSNCPNPVASPTGTITYVVTGTASNLCTDTDTVTVKVNPLPTVSAGANVDICKRDSVQLQGTGAATYTWAPSVKLSCTTCPDPWAKPDTTTTYRVIGVDTNGCKDTATVTVNVKPLPVITVSAARNKICENDTVQLTATGGSPYSWLPNNGLSCQTCANPVATLQYPTTFLVTGFLNGCGDTASVFVDVIPKPNVSAGPDKEYCMGGSETLNATGAKTYTWSPATGLSCTNCPSPVVNATTTTMYSVTGVDSIGCIATDNVIVTVNPLPAIYAGEDKTGCEGQPVQLNATGGTSYIWSPATGLSCTSCADPIALIDTTTTYTVNGTDINGCSNSDEVTVNIIRKQSVTYSKDDSLCIGQEMSLFATGGTSYTWSPATGLNSTQGEVVTAQPGATTQYRVIIKQGDCFTDTGYTTVYVFSPPTIDAGPDQDLRGGAEVRLETRSSNVATYIWSPVDGLSCSGCANPVASPRRTTTYKVTATSPEGCTAEDDVTVFVTCNGDQLFIPNTFTPNNDGLNDIFYPQGKGLTTVLRFSVYTRWGELIFDRQNIPLNDPAYGWNGTYKGDPLKPDVFVYIVRAQCEDGKPIEIKGDISLLR